MSDLMKRYIRLAFPGLFTVFVLAGCASTQQPSPPPVVDPPSVVAVIAEERLTLEDFEREYAKSAGGREAAASDSLAAYQDFLNRYVNFRLKVAAARAAGLAEDPSLQEEIATYRRNMARPYIIEQEILEPIMRQLFERMQEAVSTSHILLRVPQDASPEDTLAAYQRAVALRDSLLNGADFGDLALAYSEDPSAQMEGRPGYRGKLGVIPPGRAVPEFEEMAYATPKGELSPVFRTQFGYHILRVDDRSAAVPERSAAHIMLRPAGPTAQDTAAVLEQIQEIRTKLAAGENFGDLARQYSIHRQSADKGGDLGFYFNYYQDQGAPPAFSETLFALKEVGDVSDVVITPFGFHLIQLLDVKTLDSFEARKEDLKQLAARMPQARIAEQQFITETQDQYGVRVDTAVVFQVLAGEPTDSLLQRIQADQFSDAQKGLVFAQLGDSTHTVSDLIAFLPQSRAPQSDDVRAYLRIVVDRYMDARTLDYAAATLEDRNPEFGRIMDEFRDGLLLFRIMEDSVWSAAAQDSMALEAYYRTHMDEYNYPDRTRIITFTSTSRDEMDQVLDQLDGGDSVADLIAQNLADSTASFQVDTTYIAEATNSIYDQVLSLKQGEHTEVLPHGQRYLILYRDGEEAARPMTFDEARAQVTTDYQGVLEEQLITRLRDEYNVRMYPDRLVGAFSEIAQPTTTAAAPGAAQ